MFLNKQLFSLIFQSRRTQLRISSYDPEVLPNLPIKIWGKSIKGLMSYYRTYKQRVLLYICRWLKHCHSILYAWDKSLNCFYSIILSTGRDGHVPLFFHVVRERPISLVFLQSFKKIDFVRLKNIVNFPSISFIFSLNDRSVKRLFSKIVCSIKCFVHFHLFERSISFVHRWFFFTMTSFFKKNFVL